ncbi:hypothetical protein [Cohnella panacarvi]|uniref:hypothetical protein n=1 Tax=Cohnella panacarvi TaxID=400776 RepID=UPI00047B3774|nr:hypothetical protein [Cohnella panacarvi]
MRRMVPLLTAALLALLLAGCGSSSNNDTNSPSTIPETSPSSSSEQSQPTATNSSEPTAEPSKDNAEQPADNAEVALKDAAANIVELLRDRDLASLSDWIDPRQGLRFSPYSHIDSESSQVFKSGELPDFKDTNLLTWGIADGSGEPIELTFRDYYDKFVYNQDFAEAPNVTVNHTLAKGTTLFNGTEVYPGASYVEFFFPGFDAQFEGMDWQSLVLVFVPSGEDWKLVSIVHGQWTT